MEIIALIIMAALMPILTITAFIVGYNVNANKKIGTGIIRKKKHEPTDDEKMLQRIDNAKVY